MSERVEKQERIIRIEPNSDYAKTVIEICNLYGDALMDIAGQEISTIGAIEMKAIAVDAVARAFAITQELKAKIANN